MKKFRLTATILAFALVLGIMGFGVYAATSPSFQISNQILFTPESGQAYFSASLTTQSKETAEAADTEWEELDSAAVIQTDTGTAAATVTTGATQTISDFDFSENHMYRITIVLTNISSSDGMCVTITGLPISTTAGFTITASSNMTISETTATLNGSDLIEKNQSATITLTYQITDFTSVIAVDQSLTVTVSVPSGD